jgi:hypothetical protein
MFAFNILAWVQRDQLSEFLSGSSFRFRGGNRFFGTIFIWPIIREGRCAEAKAARN